MQVWSNLIPVCIYLLSKISSSRWYWVFEACSRDELLVIKFRNIRSVYRHRPTYSYSPTRKHDYYFHFQIHPSQSVDLSFSLIDWFPNQKQISLIKVCMLLFRFLGPTLLALHLAWCWIRLSMRLEFSFGSIE